MAPHDVDAPQIVGKPNPRNNATMFQIFQNVQYNIVQHKKYVKEMTKLYKKLDQDDFKESFSNALHYLFTFGDTSANVDRVIQFVATFCTSLDDEEEFLLFIFEIIFDCQSVSGISVRYRASQLLAAVLAALGDDASLDDDLCDKLLESQMLRLQDTRGAVRCRAALALQRLQNPMDNEDQVTRAYRFHMSCDPSSSVRRAIVISIAKSVRNVPFMMERLCDVDEAVRRAAFLHVSAVNVTQLKVRQRIHTLKVGLNERSSRVRRVVEEILIPGWLSAFKGNIIDLLKAIRLDNMQDAKDSEYVAGKLLESLFKRLPTSDLLEWLPTDKNVKLIPAERLSKEAAWYWRHLAEHLQRLDDDDTLEAVLPDLVVLAGYIRVIVESPCPSEREDPVSFNTRQYVMTELARLLRVYDAGDPVGRNMLQQLIVDVLTGDHGPLKPDVIRAFVSALDMVVPEVMPRLELVSTIIADLRDPEPCVPVPPPVMEESTEIKLKRAALRVSLNEAMEAQDDAVREQNYTLAAECKAKVDALQKKLCNLNAPAPVPVIAAPTTREKFTDSEVLRRCLLILNCALDTTQITYITPQLKSIFSELEAEIMQNTDILEPALETVALYSMLDIGFARENKAFFFAHIVNTDDEDLVDTILRCIVDVLTVHGVMVFDPEEDSELEEKTKKKSKSRVLDSTDLDEISDSTFSFSSSPTHSSVIELLLKIMEGTNASSRLIITEGLCRLLILGHLESPGILSRLLLLWFNPATEDEDMLRQTIGVFFQTFPVSVESAQEQIQKSTLPTLRALANAPASSPISEIDQEAVVRFVVSLTRVNHETIDSQGAMALLLSSYLVQRPHVTESGLICRMLSFLSPPRDVATCVDLAKTLRDLCAKLPDKQSCRNLTRYLGALELVERSSINKTSGTTAVDDGTLDTDDFTRASRATSSMRFTLKERYARLTHPIARSTHVVVNETVEEETETEVNRDQNNAELDKITSTECAGTSSIGVCAQTEQEEKLSSERSGEGSSSSGVSPVKKPKIQKKGKKAQEKPVIEPRRTSRSSSGRSSGESEKQPSQETARSSIKRTRSQRSLEDIDRGQPSVSPKDNTQEEANVTIRKSNRGGAKAAPNTVAKPTKTKPVTKKTQPSGKATNKTADKKEVTENLKRLTRSSSGSNRSSVEPNFDSSSDDTELHTIVYDNDIEQSLMNDSDVDSNAGDTSRRNVTIPGSPTESSEESDPVPELKQIKSKRGGKQKK